MAYQSLYRRYRPRRFSDVRDQEPVVRALRNAVREDRVGHAYLFSGPRGTGKTSTARILAKALNCEDLVDGEPCGVCESCVAIDTGTSYDVQELDAASNNGVEDVRELISRVALGSPGRTKVYILDEVHMLSKAASAALLKTLEEPPDHVVFVLATTDPHKVLPTIRSRTQHYEFHLLSAEDLAEHVRWVIHDAELDLPDDAVDWAVRQGGGSARDTLSALERVAAGGMVSEDGEAVVDLLDAVAASDTSAALAAVSSAVATGRDPRVLGESLLARLRDVFLLRMGAPTAHLTAAELARVQAWADQLGDRATTRALEAVGDALLAMRQALDPRIPLEVALVKLTRADADGSVDALAARVSALEAALAGGATPAPATPAPATPAPVASAPSASAPAATGAPNTPAPAPGPAGDAGPAAASPTESAPAAADATAEPAGAAPAGGSGGGPAAQARAALAAQRAERASKTGGAPAPRPAPSAGRAAPPPPPTPRRDPAAAAAQAAPPASDPAAAPEPAVAPESAVAPEPTAPSEVRSVDAVPEPGPEPAPPASSAEPPAASSPGPSSATAAASPSPEPAAAPAAASPEPAPAVPSPSPEPAAAPASPPPAAAPAHAGGPATGDLADLWSARVLPRLSGLAKAMFQSAELVSLADGVAVLAVENEHHVQNGQRKAGDVEAALAAEVGSPVTVRLEVAAGGSSARPAAGASSSPSPAEPAAEVTDDPDEHLAGTDVHDLDDAPDAPASGIDALTEAFPGAEFVDPS